MRAGAASSAIGVELLGLTREELNAKCADCGHSRESHDYSGCLCWIMADADRKCPCKVWKAEKSDEPTSKG